MEDINLAPSFVSPSQHSSHACCVIQGKLSKDRELAGSRTGEPQFHNEGGGGARHKHRAEIRHTGRQLWEEVRFNGMEGREPSDQPGFHLPSPCWASQAASRGVTDVDMLQGLDHPGRGASTQEVPSSEGGFQIPPLVLSPPAQRGASALCSDSCPEPGSQACQRPWP